MKITQEEFYQLENFRLELKICDMEAEHLVDKRRMKIMAKKIIDFEDSNLVGKISGNKNKKKDIKDRYQQLRNKISERLGIESLDKYLVDDVSLEVIHENEVEEKLTEQRINAFANN